MYEIFVRSFADSNHDGIGDLKGITEQLDYLKTLGVEGIWLTPFNKATSYHKYDIEDYYKIDPEYGTLADFQNLVREAHARNIKVVMDLVVNHCSSQHPWFLEACANWKSPYHDFFVWQSPKNIKSEPEHWHAPAGADTNASDFQKYYGFFWSGMPDLNFDNPAVRKEVLKIARYWLTEGGVDGFRLDAAQHIYPEGQEAKNYAWWREFRAEMEQVKEGFYMVGEVANSQKAVAPYLQEGMHAAFNFDLARDINRTLLIGKDVGLVDSLLACHNLYQSYTSSYIDATFITNHDQDRIMSNMDGDMRRAMVASTLLFTLPGSPYLYYGEEIGMMGKKPDELIREPMPWSYRPDDFSVTRWEKPFYTVSGKVSPVVDQMIDPNSMYSHYRQLGKLRLGSPSLRFGDLLPVKSNDSRLIAYIRRYNERERVLVIHNVSREALIFNLDPEFGNLVPLFAIETVVPGKTDMMIPPMNSAVFQIR
jgi:glycosidase